MDAAIQRACRIIKTIHNNIANNFNSFFSQEYLAPAVINFPEVKYRNSSFPTVNELFDITVLWAVPKKRRSLERRRNRKFGWPRYHYKLYLPKTNILMCPKCLSYHEAGNLCPKCYDTVKQVTLEMQEAIKKELNISPIEKEVVVLFNDDDKSSKEYFQGKKIVEMDKPRPKIFSDNLLQKSTQSKSDNKTISVPLKPLKEVSE